MNLSYIIQLLESYLYLAINAYLTTRRAMQTSPGAPLQKITRRL